MEFGICLPTKAQSWAVVQRAEELGFTYAWFYDTQLLSADVLVAMGAAAMKTSRIKLCAGVFIPSNRIAPVAANALATLNALAPGRVVFGIIDWIHRPANHGLGSGAAGADLRNMCEVVEGLLKGKTVEWSEEGGTHKIRFFNPDLGLININDPIPTFLSAFGPKARALTAKLGAGWIGAVSYPQREQADIEDIRAAWQRTAATMNDFYAAASTGGCVLDEGEARRQSARHGAGRPLRGDRRFITSSRRINSARCSRSTGHSRSRPSSRPIARSMKNMSRRTPVISAIIAAI